MTMIGAVPYDEAMLAAEREGKSPYDYAPQSPGIAAIRAIAGNIGALAASPRQAPPASEGARPGGTDAGARPGGS
jgi:hypothetical protein